MTACSNSSNSANENGKNAAGNSNTSVKATSDVGQTAVKNEGAADLEIKAGSSVTVFNPKIPTLDPTQWQGQILVGQGTLLEGLYGYNQDNEIVPKIATGYTVSDDKNLDIYPP